MGYTYCKVISHPGLGCWLDSNPPTSCSSTSTSSDTSGESQYGGSVWAGDEGSATPPAGTGDGKRGWDEAVVGERGDKGLRSCKNALFPRRDRWGSWFPVSTGDGEWAFGLIGEVGWSGVSKPPTSKNESWRAERGEGGRGGSCFWRGDWVVGMYSRGLTLMSRLWSSSEDRRSRLLVLATAIGIGGAGTGADGNVPVRRRDEQSLQSLGSSRMPRSAARSQSLPH